MTAPTNREQPPLSPQDRKALHEAVIGLWIVDGNKDHYVAEPAEGGLMATGATGKPVSAAWVMVHGRRVATDKGPSEV